MLSIRYTHDSILSYPPRSPRGDLMDYRLELVAVPVSDVDRAKAFYVDQAGFTADHDHTP